MFDRGEPGHPLISSAGTPSFFPAVLSHIRNASPNPLPLDPVILQSILLCIIAGDKHLILQTSPEDIGLVVKITVWVSVPRWEGVLTRGHLERLLV